MLNLPVSITQFASDPNLLNVPLWSKQSEILEQFWQGDHNLAVWTLGRGSGKTFMAAVLGTYAACMLASEYKKYLRPGERFYIISIANTIDQAKISLQGVKDLINGSPILKPLIVRETTDTLELSNGAVFRALPASSRGGRGLSAPLIIFDEIGHAIDTDGGNAAGASLYQALSPTTKRFPGLGKILMLSTPWTQAGIFWEKYQQASSGNFAHMQVAQYATWQVNPHITEESLASEKAANPELFAVEYGANFSQSFSAFLDGSLVDAAINSDHGSLSPISKFKGNYVLSIDPAKGGKGRDSYVCCICHFDNDCLIVDLFHEFSANYYNGKKQEVSVTEVEAWIEQQHRRYNFQKIVLDQYNSQGIIQKLSSRMPIEELVWTVKTKTQAFSQLRELFISGNINLYSHEKAVAQLKGLTVVYKSGGTWSVSGGTGCAVDDFPMALAGCVLIAAKKSVYDTSWLAMM